MSKIGSPGYVSFVCRDMMSHKISKKRTVEKID